MKNLFLSTFSKAINNYLKLDPESSARLKRLNGKWITVELLPFHFIFQLGFNEAEVMIRANEDLLSEAKVSGTPLQMLNMMINKHNRQHFFSDDLKIEGNAELGQRVVELFDDMQIDWEELLSHLVGDVPAYHTGRFVQGIKAWLKKADTKFSTDMNEYLHEEIQWFPQREALTDFFNEVDILRMDLDRLEAKFINFKTLLTKHENEQ